MADLEEQLRAVDRNYRRVLSQQKALYQAGSHGGDGSGIGAAWFGFIEHYNQWRYEHPVAATCIRILGWILSLLLLLVVLWHAAATPVGKVTGLDNVRARITYTYYAAIWASRINEGDITPMEPERYPGSIEQVIDNVMVVSYYKHNQQYRRLIKPANVDVHNPRGLADWAAPLILKGVVFDFYLAVDQRSGHDVWATVIWDQRTPINVELVELGHGEPEIDPPTAIVNQIYSQYYWQKAVNGE